MENLPPPIIAEILSRLPDSTHLARCRLACRTLRSLSCDVWSITVVGSGDLFQRSRTRSTRDLVPLFHSRIVNLLSLFSGGGSSLRSLSIAVEEPDAVGGEEEDEDEDEDEGGVDEADDLHLTAADFLSQWLPAVGGGLTSLSIGDYWSQACWRRSQALRLISDQKLIFIWIWCYIQLPSYNWNRNL